jgi:hypothetical protein
LAIRDLISNKKIDPDNIFYYSCHNIDTFEQLNEIIKLFLHWRHKARPEQLYIFIDEITLVKGWQKGIKYLLASNKLKKSFLFLIGSVFDKDTPFDKKWCTKTISSLNFGEFLALINPDIAKKINKKNYTDFQEQLEYYQDIYFLTGGFITAINEFKTNGSVNQGVYSNYLYRLISDIAQSGRDTVLLRQILENVLGKLGQPIGFQTIAKKTKAKSHITVNEYLKILESMFSLQVVYQADLEKSLTAKAKKVYFRDPFIFWLFYSYTSGALNYWQFSREKLHRQDIFSALVENVIFGHLVKGGLPHDGQVSYWRDNTKKLEINFLVNRGKKVLPLLIRYYKKISEQDKLIFKKAGFKKGIIISSKELNLSGQIKIIPLTYFLLFC